MTNETSLKGIPLIRQYMVRTFKMNPLYKQDEQVRMSLSSVMNKKVKILELKGTLKEQLWSRELNMFVKARVKVDDYSSTGLTAPALNGINVIRKAIMLERVKTFQFRESVSEWVTLPQPKSLRRAVTADQIDLVWDELKVKDRVKLLKELKLDQTIAELDYDRLPKHIQDVFRDMDKNTLLNMIALIVGLTLINIFLNILDVPKSDYEPEPDFKDIDLTQDFDHTSSWVGTVTYFPDGANMDINMRGKKYAFCGVPESVYDSFESATSKGKFYHLAIKDNFNCF